MISLDRGGGGYRYQVVNITAGHLLGITLRLAIERGEIEAEHPLPDGPWVLNRRRLETGTAAQLVERTRKHKRAPALAVHDQGLLDLSAT